jgi:hypothetical protein
MMMLVCLFTIAQVGIIGRIVPNVKATSVVPAFLGTKRRRMLVTAMEAA